MSKFVIETIVVIDDSNFSTARLVQYPTICMQHELLELLVLLCHGSERSFAHKLVGVLLHFLDEFLTLISISLTVILEACVHVQVVHQAKSLHALLEQISCRHRLVSLLF